MKRRVIAFPYKGIAYTECFYAALEGLGVEVLEGVWSGRWFLDNVRRGDVVHMHWPSFSYNHGSGRLGRAPAVLRFIAFLTIARARGARFVWTAHNLYPHDGGKEMLHRTMRRVVVALASRVLVHGESAAKIVAVEFGVPDSKLCRIQHGNWIGYYPHTLDRAQARARLQIPPDQFVFGFIGICKPYKNMEAMIEAFTALGMDATLLIAGKFQSQEYRQRIESKLKAVNPARLVFRPGFVPDDELQVYAQAMDVLLLPYTEILTSGSAMLAFSFGRPVIATDLGSMKDVVPPSCGVLYAPENPTGLVDAMRQVMRTRFEANTIDSHARSFKWTDSAARVATELELP